MKYEKKNKEVWAGTHLGVSFEVNHWVSPPNSIEPVERHHWTHYIFLHLDRIPASHNPDSFWLTGRKQDRNVYYDYHEHHVINHIEFHGGCTWYSKEHGFDGASKVVKIGCDYQHYWDEGRVYSIGYVISEVEKTIESFRLLVPDYKYWCGGNGKLYDLKDGLIKDESFYSNEYYGDKDWFKELLKPETKLQP